jgi:hypothetical protein
VLWELIGENASRRMDLVLIAAVLSAAGMAAVAFIRASNRYYHLIYPELNLENSTTVLIVWITLAAGMNSIDFIFPDGHLYYLVQPVGHRTSFPAH